MAEAFGASVVFVAELDWDGEDALFADIAAGLGVTEDAARMRYGRALTRLARAIDAIRTGRLHEILGEDAT